MRTTAEIRKKLGELRDVNSDPEVKRLQEALYKAIRKVREDRTDEVQRWELRLKALLATQQTRKESRVLAMSDELRGWWKKRVHGWESGETHKLVWKTPDEKFVIQHFPGCHWSDNGGSHYGEARYELITRLVKDLRGDEGLKLKEWTKYRFGKLMIEEAEKVISAFLLAAGGTVAK